MASNFSVIPVRWLFTVDSEMAFFLFHSLTEGVLVSFKTHVVQEKNNAKLVNSEVNFTRKTDFWERNQTDWVQVFIFTPAEKD